MERVNQSHFYELGAVLRRVTARETDTPAIDAFFDLMEARRVLRRLLDGKPSPIRLSVGPAKTLLDHFGQALDKVRASANERYGGFALPTENAPPVPAWTWTWARKLLDQFETVFNEEMAQEPVYYVPQRGIFSTPDLVDRADQSFPEHLRGQIPEKTKIDWRAAGRCLAFNLPSASGFHVARAVEGTMEAYYQQFAGKPGEELKTWNDYLVALDKIAAANPTPTPEQKTLTELRQMKDDYRNPIMHPRVVLDEADARMLFDNGESVIIAMAQELVIARAGVQPNLGLLALSELAKVPDDGQQGKRKATRRGSKADAEDAS